MISTVQKLEPQSQAAAPAHTRDIAVPPLKIVVVGHVDHGKSTLVGRLLNDTGSMPEGKVEAIRVMSERRGMPFEWAFLMDALQAERDQGITIDTTQIHFHTEKRNYVMIDAPGHHEFIKNMVTGAASADAAILVVDAVEGVREQTRRHGYLLHLLGIRQVVVAMNKMDMADWDEARYSQVAGETRKYLSEIGVPTDNVHIVPISARNGDNMVNPSDSSPWYQGIRLVDALDAFQPPVAQVDLPLRLCVQDVYKFDERRIIAGRIETGRLNVGDELMFSPQNKIGKIKSIEYWHGKGDLPVAASAGQSVGITLEDQIFVERGSVVSHRSNMPMLTNVFRAKLFWLGHNPLEAGKTYKLKLNAAEYQVTVDAVEKVINIADLTESANPQLERNGIGEVILRSRGLMSVDAFNRIAKTGRIVLIEDYDIVGGGLISMEGYADQRPGATVKSENLTRVEHRVRVADRWIAQGHRSGVIWLTGLSGSGKSTLAFGLEQYLFSKGLNAYVLDGDNIRHGLTADLGFSPEDRAENIRRVAEVARLAANAGVIVITSFISPYRADRDRARAIIGDTFHEVHVKADVATCEGRDPKGLYKKARAGEIKEFTGISAPYEAPNTPEIIVDTSSQAPDESIAQLAEYVLRNFRLEAHERPDNYVI